MPFELNEKMDMIDKKDVKIIAEESKKEAGVSLEFNNNMVENGETSAKMN